MYKRMLVLLCSSFLVITAMAQPALNQINIINFTTKAKLPADIDKWNNIPAALMLTVQRMPQATVQGVKLVIQIKQGGNKICGNTIDAAQVLDIAAIRNFTAGELIGYLNSCTILKGGSTTLCAQFFNIDRYPISKEVCREFFVDDGTMLNYNAPQNISPTNGEKCKRVATNAPQTFRWTPVTPRPKETVTYRLKVWQLMLGQNGMAAMKSNTPIVEKEVTNITQAMVTNINATLCNTPYLCQFVWNVQAQDNNGKPIGNNNGTSELFTFYIK